MTSPRYVLITPARNEEAFIEKTLNSVVTQTVLPKRWIIVSDGSTDRTDALVRRYAASHDFIQLLRVEKNGARNFGSKVGAFRLGYGSLRDADYEFLGNLDADVSFSPEYFEKVLERFQQNPRLGVAGGIILDSVDGHFIPQRISSNSVAGAVQLFRRSCYEEIGGYIPIRTGGIDSAAEITARSRGWEVMTFRELEVLHHRRVACVGTHILRARYRQGITHYLLGYHPLFQLVKCVFRTTEQPYVLGSVLVLLGYIGAAVRRLERPLSDSVVRYFQREQMDRLLSAFRVPKADRKAPGMAEGSTLGKSARE